jgi:hypothetical protein
MDNRHCTKSNGLVPGARKDNIYIQLNDCTFRTLTDPLAEVVNGLQECFDYKSKHPKGEGDRLENNSSLALLPFRSVYLFTSSDLWTSEVQHAGQKPACWTSFPAPRFR